jgi:sec-independent protein translocase protein TatA
MFDNPIAIGIAVIVIVLLVAGPKRLPHFGRGLGQGMREFKDGITGEAHEFKEGITGETEKNDQISLSKAPAQERPADSPSSASGRESEPIA